MASFHVDGRVSVKMEIELATRLGEFLVEADTPDKQLKALGHRLIEVDAAFEGTEFAEDQSVPSYAPARKAYMPAPVRSTGGHHPVFESRVRRQSL